MRLAKSLVATGEIELMSMTSLPLLRPSATPSLPNSTASTSGVSGTIRMMTSDASATAFARVRGLAALVDQRLRDVLHAIERERVAGVDQVARHRAAHDAQADESDVHSSSFIQPRPCGGARLRLVLAADLAVVAEPVERGEDEAVVDLAGAGLVAARIVGDLDVRDAVLEPLVGRHQVTLHHLHVVDVVLDVEIVVPDPLEDALGLLAWS